MKKTILFFAAFAGLFLHGCRSDEPGGQGGEGNDGFSLTFDVVNSVNQTRSTVAPLPGEEQVNTMHVFFFEFNSNGTGKFIESVFMKNEDGTPIGNMGAIELVFPGGSALDNDTNYNMLVCANVSDSSLDTYFTGLNENEAILKLKLEVTDVLDNQEEYRQLMPGNSLPMSGRTVRYASQGGAHVDLVRSVARFDVSNMDRSYKLVSASVWNAFRSANVWENTFMNFSAERTMRYYGVNGLDDSSKGQLYAFENYVDKPEEKDRNTTCLILGLEDPEGGGVYYYRVNVNARNIGQYLKRNNVYTTTVKRVLGRGADTEHEAYLSSDKFLLDVDVNGWNIDDNGNIQYDGENILAIPASSVNFNSGGGTLEYHIYTYGRFELRISGKNLPAGITASLDKGNMLVVTAEPSVVERSGEIELQFGEMRVKIPVVQTGDTEELELNPKGMDLFPATGAMTSDAITVTSSGEWTARIYNNDGHFSFSESGIITRIDGHSGESFNISLHKENDQEGQYHAFLIVSLESDPTINRTIVLRQRGQGGLVLSPDHDELEFGPTGMTVYDRTDYYEFEVESSDGESDLEWKAEILEGGYEFEIRSYPDRNKFYVIGDFNDGITRREATLRVSQVDKPSVYIDITVNQDVHDILLTPDKITDHFYAEGGSTVPIRVNSSFNWTATITSVGNTVTFGGGETTIYGRNLDEFTVEFPKLETSGVNPEAVVTVNINNSDETGIIDVGKAITIRQYGLSADPIIFRTLNRSFSTLSHTDHANYIDVMGESMRSAATVGPDAPVYMLAGFDFDTTTGWDNLTDDTDIYQINDTSLSGRGQTVRDWLEGSKNRVLLVSGDTNQSSILQNLGLGFNGSSASVGAGIDRKVRENADHPLFDFLFRTGPFTDGENDIRAHIAFKSADGTNGQASSWPATFIPIIMTPSNTSRCMLGIDPTLRIVYCGDMEMFRTTTNSSANFDNPANIQFMNNLIAWMAYAARYGDDFLVQFR